MPDTNIEQPQVSESSADQSTLSTLSPAQTYDVEPSGWSGVLGFGGTMAIIIGVLHALSGLSAIFKDEEYFVVPQRDLIVNVDYTAWGVAQLIFGILAVAVGWGILKRQKWARIGGVIFAGLSIILNLGFLDAKPVWSSMVIAFDVLLIFALTAHGDAPRREGTRPRWQSPYGPS
jgi:hypothetical protein